MTALWLALPRAPKLLGFDSHLRSGYRRVGVALVPVIFAQAPRGFDFADWFRRVGFWCACHVRGGV